MRWCYLSSTFPSYLTNELNEASLTDSQLADNSVSYFTNSGVYYLWAVTDQSTRHWYGHSPPRLDQVFSCWVHHKTEFKELNNLGDRHCTIFLLDYIFCCPTRWLQRRSHQSLFINDLQELSKLLVRHTGTIDRNLNVNSLSHCIEKYIRQAGHLFVPRKAILQTNEKQVLRQTRGIQEESPKWFLSSVPAK